MPAAIKTVINSPFFVIFLLLLFPLITLLLSLLLSLFFVNL